MSDYDPNSYNAVLATIHTELRIIREQQNANAMLLRCALDRVDALERWKIWIYGMAAGVAVITSAIFSSIKWLFSKS